MIIKQKCAKECNEKKKEDKKHNYTDLFWTIETFFTINDIF